MEHLFSVDGKLFSVYSRLVDLILLNILFVITCIPIVTAGMALCALYQTTLQINEHTESYIYRDYFRNLKQGLHPNGVAGLLATGCIGICLLDLRALPFLQASAAGMILLCLQLLFLFILYLFLLYISSLPKPYRQTFRNASRNAFYLAFKYLPISLTCVCISLLPAGCLLLFPGQTKWISFFILTAGFSLIALAHSYLLLKIFKKEDMEL